MLSLVMEEKKLSPEEATHYLWQFTSQTHQSPQEFYEKVARLLDDEKPETKPLPYFNERVLEHWIGAAQREGAAYFRTRGISEEVCSYFKLGFNPLARSFKPDLGSYEGAGVIFPHFWKGRLVGWQTRWLDEERPKWVPKYTNTTDFPREVTLWGFDFASKQSELPIVVESVPTALRLISAGYPAIATFGSQLTPSQLQCLRGFQAGVMLAPDNDEAGRKWLYTAQSYLERYTKVLVIPPVNGEGADLGDLTSLEELSTHLKGVYYGYEASDS